MINKEVRSYISPYELEKFVEFASERVGLGARIQGRSSPRRGKVVELTPSDFFIPESDRVVIPFVDLRETKDTRDLDIDEDLLDQIGGRHRYSWVPRDLYNDIMDYCARHEIGPDEPIFDIGKRQYSRLIRSTADELAEVSGDKAWQQVSTHSFRVFFATNGYYRLGISKEFLMAMGDWRHLESIEPYLEQPLPVDVQNHLISRGVIDEDVSPNVDRDHRDRGDYPVSFQSKIDRHA
jgi:integrase